MKVAGAKKVHYDSGPNMTPLVDVVMVILIFLMLAGSFGTAEHFMATKTPFHATGGGGSPPAAGWTPPKILDVRVMADGNYTITGEQGTFMDAEILKERLEHRATEFGSKDNVEIVLRPLSGEVPWDVLAPLYDSCLRGGFQKVSFAMTGAQ